MAGGAGEVAQDVVHLGRAAHDVEEMLEVPGDLEAEYVAALRPPADVALAGQRAEQVVGGGQREPAGVGELLGREPARRSADLVEDPQRPRHALDQVRTPVRLRRSHDLCVLPREEMVVPRRVRSISLLHMVIQGSTARSGRSDDGRMRPRITLLLAATVVSSLLTAPARASGYPGPKLRESPDVLAKALTCPATFSGKHEPVLLVHATTETGQRNWSSNYGRVLPKLGYDVCTVELVDEATGDIQASAERTVYAIRTIASRANQKVQVVGHSQGPLEVRWAIKYWPDIANLVDDLVGIAAPYHGWRQTDIYCGSACVAALWQMRMESKF